MHAFKIVLQFSEEEAPHWLKAEFLQGGLHITTPPSPFEEKGEARSAGSTPTEPITPQAHVTDLCASAIDLKISVRDQYLICIC